MGGIEDELKAAETTEQWSVDGHPGGTCVPQGALLVSGLLNIFFKP